MERGEGDLRGVEELVGPFFGNRVDENAVGRAGDEVADVFIAGERRHGAAVGRTGLVGGEDPRPVASVRASEVSLVGALPGSAAAPDGGLRLFGIGVDGRDRLELDQAEFRCGFLSHVGFSLWI